MRLNLGIKDKHINEGERTNPQNCAIARALRDRVRNLDKVGVFPDYAYLVVKNRSKTQAFKAKLNKAASQFIKNFDDGRAVNSFKIGLNFKPIKVAKELV
jgi:hypothetical protein